MSLMQEIEAHLQDCELCLQRLDQLPAGQLVEGIRRSYQLDEDDLGSESSTNAIDEDSMPFVVWQNFTPSRHASLGIDRYELVGEIGAGPMGKTFLALDADKKAFALKIPHPWQMTSADHVQLFLSDAGLAFSVSHPHILPIADFGRWQENLPFVASPHSQAPNLKRFCKTAFLADEITLNLLFSQLCLAVEYAHRHSLLHRHLHPNNVFIAEGPKLMVSEFGMHYDGRYQFELIQRLEQTTPFISPEAANNDPAYIDQRNDIFAMGKILKLLLTITPDLPAERRAAWSAIHRRCTRTRRSDRFQSVREIMRDLSQVEVH